MSLHEGSITVKVRSKWPQGTEEEEVGGVRLAICSATTEACCAAFCTASQETALSIRGFIEGPPIVSIFHFCHDTSLRTP